LQIFLVYQGLTFKVFIFNKDLPTKFLIYKGPTCKVVKFISDLPSNILNLSSMSLVSY